mgnify:CR=1 FL=1
MSPFLVRKVQPPHIYVRGDGRLNNNTQSFNLSTLFTFTFPSPLFFFFLVLRLFFLLQGGEPRGPRGDQVDLGQPITAARPDGVPPGRVGFRVCKSTPRLSCISRCRSGLLRRELRLSPSALEVHGYVFVCQHTFWRLRWGRSFERSPARSSTKRSSSSC